MAFGVDNGGVYCVCQQNSNPFSKELFVLRIKR